jgi:sec-independent protein translocase protein TatA
MLGLGWQELLIVLVIIMIIFGAGKLPTLFKDLGSGVKEFRTAATDEALPDANGAAKTTTPTSTIVDGDAAPAARVNAAPASDPSRV